jgi:hypothetical protein
MIAWRESRRWHEMRQLAYEEVVELAKTDMESAIREAKINWQLAKNRPEEGTWAGLYLELVERREVA